MPTPLSSSTAELVEESTAVRQQQPGAGDVTESRAPLDDALDDGATGDQAQRFSATVLREGLRLLIDAAKEERRVFAVAVAGSAVYALMTVLAASVLGHVTDHTILPAFRDGRTSAGRLGGAVLAIGLVAVVKSLGIIVRRVGAGTMQYRLQATYRRRVSRRFLSLPVRWHAARPTGQLLSNANSDVEAMFWPISPFPFACGVLVMLAAALVQMLLVDWRLALVGVLVFPCVAALNYAYNRVQAPTAAQAQELRAAVASVAHESFDGALVVKTLGREDEEEARFRVRTEALRDVNTRLGRVRGIFDPLMEALPTLGVLAVLVIGSYRVEAHVLTAGSLVTVAYLFVQLSQPIRAIGWVLYDMPRAVVGRARVHAVLAQTDALPSGALALPRGDTPLSLGLHDVDFSYVAGVPVLRDVQVDLTAGSTVALVGATGAGKSTLAALVVRLADPDSGAVTFDGVDLVELLPGEVSRAAAYVAQTTFVFDDDVRGNVTLGLDVDDAQVWAALRLAQADGFVAALPQGLSTLVGERGTSLSGGQRQRLALARALVRKPRLLVLDDATSSVDPQVEAAILGGLRDAGLSGELRSTVLVVAYRRATIALADEVLWLADGTVLARGPHRDLLGRVPGYRDLVTAYDGGAP